MVNVDNGAKIELISELEIILQIFYNISCLHLTCIYVCYYQPKFTENVCWGSHVLCMERSLHFDPWARNESKSSFECF